MPKTTRPALSGVLPRPRLFRLLDQSRRRPLTWIAGPAGSGKTTLVSSWLDARRPTAIWYHVDARDGEAATFVHHLGRAAAAGRRPMGTLRPEDWQRLGTFALDWFHEFFARLRAPFALVLDDYQEAPAQGLLHEMLRVGLDELPQGGRVIVMSRDGPPEAFARLRASGAVAEIGWEQLRLTDSESAAMSRSRLRSPLGRAAVAELHRRAGGWAAGLTLLLERAGTSGNPASPADPVASEAVFDYFAAEIFAKHPLETRRLLMATAFLPSTTAAMAAELAGIEEAEGILTDLARRHYFTERRAAADPVFQFHPLFREFLLSRARAGLPATRLDELRRRAAAILAAAGRPEEAVDLLGEARDWPALVALVVREAPALVVRGRHRTLQQWIGLLPTAAVERQAWLQYWLGTARGPFEPAQARPHLEQAFRLFADEGSAEGSFSAWAGVVESFVAEWGHYQPLDDWIARLDDLQRRHPAFPSPEIEGRVTSAMFMALMFRQPQHPEIALWAQRAFEQSRQADLNRRMLNVALLSTYHLWTGEHARAAVALEMLRDLATAPDASPQTRIAHRSAEATFHWQLAEPERCLEAAAAGLELARSSGVHLLDSNLLANRVYGALLTADRAAARNGLEEMAAVVGTSNLHAAHYHFLAAWEALVGGDPPRALEHTQVALDLSIQAGSPFAEAWNHHGMALVLHELDRREAAITHLRRTRAMAREFGGSMLEFMVLLAEAQFALDDDRVDEARARLREAMTLGRRQGYLMTRWWRPAVMARLCLLALEAGIEVEYVQRLVRIHRLTPDPLPVEVDDWPWPVRIETLGEFSVTVGGVPLPSSRRAQPRPLDLLKALVAFGGVAPDDALADALWPEASGDQAARTLTINLHRLRALLGRHDAILMRDRRLSLDRAVVRVDTWAFARLLERADAEDRRGRANEAVALRVRALALYRGPFLPDDLSADWAISPRERLRASFLRHTTRLCRHWAETSQWEQAIEGYRRALEVDDLAEELYQGLMTSYSALGRRAEALVAYRRCREVLRARLGVPPAPATEALARSLQA